MGKAVFISIIIIHGLIHLMGFAKSFGLLRITELSQDISKPLGLLWLLSAILFFSVGILYLSNKDWWWIPGIFAIILSLFLIVVFWQDAKFGIIPNIIILAAVVIGFALWNFDNQVDEEIKRILAVNNREAQVITEDMIQEMPDPVQRWLRNSGVIGKEKIHTVYLRQKGSMRLKPEQKGWMKADAEQYFTIDKPAPLILAPIRFKKFCKSTISGSRAAFRIIVVPGTVLAAMIRFSVAPTLGKSNSISFPDLGLPSPIINPAFSQTR
jgi:CHASE2 domain-containing sensor protein